MNRVSRIALLFSLLTLSLTACSDDTTGGSANNNNTASTNNATNNSASNNGAVCHDFDSDGALGGEACAEATDCDDHDNTR